MTDIFPVSKINYIDRYDVPHSVTINRKYIVTVSPECVQPKTHIEHAKNGAEILYLGSLQIESIREVTK
jgi:hypothetical protein